MESQRSLADGGRALPPSRTRLGQTTLALSAILLAFSGTASANVSRCDSCTAGQAKARAMVSYRTDGRYHVVDVVNNTVRSYNVRMDSTPGFDNPWVLSPDVVATQVSTPRDVQEAFKLGMRIRSGSANDLTIPADALPGADGTNINSAVDIIGNTQNLSILAGYLGQSWGNLARVTATRIVNKVVNDVSIKIEFADGTSILARPVAVISGNSVEIHLAYVRNSARTDDGGQLPDSTDDFDGLVITLGLDSAGFTAFEELATRFNIPIYRADGTRIGGGSGGGGCRADVSGRGRHSQVILVCRRP